jgi:hypothetical protein
MRFRVRFGPSGQPIVEKFSFVNVPCKSCSVVCNVCLTSPDNFEMLLF